jgi:tripartite ATP-independent transporter DctM subunit
MSNTTIGLVGVAGLFLLFILRMPVGLSMLITGLLGNIAIRGWQHALPSLSSETFAIASFYQLSVIPMFVLMGNIAGASGMGRDLYNAAYAWVGHIRGGLASATIIACACFASLCGSSAASAVTMGRVALPEMRRYKYDDALATGTVASGGTLGFTFPPSAGLVIYGILTEQAIGRLFLAGVLPGLILTLLFIATIFIVTTIRREAGPPGPRASMAERVATLGRASSIVLVVFVTIGGIYLGLFTPIEASGFGASFTLLVALVRRKLSIAVMKAIVLQTMRTTATVFLILMGAYVFIPFMTLSELPEIVVRFLLSFDLGTTGILIIIILTYLALGTFMEDFSMLILTLPVVLPVLKALGVDLVWFGVVAVLIIQMGLLSPPVGINVFIVKGIVPDVPMYTIFRGIWPFWYAMGLLIALLLIFPQLALFLPNTMFGR